jgi:AcrR family transcriptional regulator
MVAPNKAPSATQDGRSDQIVEPLAGSPPRRRRGRPADSDGLTRQRILAAARECFAEYGYARASTHMVADRVGLTTPTLYHHFRSKRELYLAVFDEVEEELLREFRAAVERYPTFIERFEAILDTAVRLNRSDPVKPGFVLSVLSDLARDPDLRPALDSSWRRRDSFFAWVVDAAIASGELKEADRGIALEMITMVVIGIVVVGRGIPSAQARTVEGIKRLIAGTLIST